MPTWVEPGCTQTNTDNKAYAVALIGKYDWPTHWPSLMGDVITLLRQGTDNQKDGALKVVVELMKETLDEEQLPAITSELLPVLLEMVNDEQVSSYLDEHMDDA